MLNKDEFCFCGYPKYAALDGMPMCVDCLEELMDEDNLVFAPNKAKNEALKPGTILEFCPDFLDD